jgi:hypothetical protein
MALMARRSTMPTAAADAITATILHWYNDLIGRVMTSEASRTIVRQNLFDRLQAGTLDVAWVIQAAEAGHQDADLALRQYAATFIDHGREAELLVQVRAYVVRSLLRPPVTYPRGKNIIDTLTRDIGVAVMVDAARASPARPPRRACLPGTSGPHKGPERTGAMSATSRCPKCGEHSFLIPLHGEKGGPKLCPLCVGAWNAEHGRRRNRGRVAIRAIRGFLDSGGRDEDVDKLKLCASLGKYRLFDLDPLGYMAGAAETADEVIELTSELLADTLRLTHPDCHPPERQDLAHRVTQGLLALTPFVFPAPKPEPLEPKPQQQATMRTDTKAAKLPKQSYPCIDCRSAVPADYCDACAAEYEKRQQQEFERRTAKQREQYARRRKRLLRNRPQKLCASCGKEFNSKRDDARFCSSRCRQRMRRKAPVTGKSNAPGVHSFKRDIHAVLDRHRAVFLNDLLPPDRTSAQYQALCRAARMLEEAGEIESFRYWVRWDRPGHVVLIKPGHEVEDPDKVPRLEPHERLAIGSNGSSNAAEVRS